MRTLMCALVVGASVLMSAGCGVDTDEIQSSIRKLIESDDALAADERDEYRDQVAEYYSRRSFEPVWVGSGNARERLRALVEAFCRSNRVGLNPADYATVDLARLIDAAHDRSGSDDERAARMGRLDVAATHSLMTYTSDVLEGRIDPENLGAGWHAPVHKVDLLSILSDTMSMESVHRLSDRVAEMHPQYGKLIHALRTYRAIASRGGWPTVPPGEPLEPGSSGARVRALIARLAVTGDLDSTLLAESGRPGADGSGRTAGTAGREAENALTSALFTEQVADAVRSAQQRHGLDVDGVAGEAVIAALNVPVGERIRQIEVNLERWRWIPSILDSRYLYVNIPAFELHAFDGGREVLSMAVVVGKVYEENATPVFSDTMEYVVFNPYWNVPESIAAEEIVPAARRDRSYLTRNDYEVVRGWNANAGALNPRTVNLDLVEDGTYRIRQKPGGRNALGRIKFMFPNEFNIYLHDTPADYLFTRAERAYSHGCIRVEKPEELAEFVFSGGDWSSERIEKAIASGKEHTESLPGPLPVYILYWTAFVDGNGLVNFREDLYGNDRALLDALAAPDRPAAVPCDSLLAPITS